MLAGKWDLDPDEFQRGVVEAVDAVIDANPGRTVAAVCHGGTINAYLSAMLGLDQLMFFFPEYTSVSRVRASRDGARSLLSVNETGHLRFAHRNGS
jgi:probable phosphoglycerate mutase